jgi:hypothetical protein
MSELKPCHCCGNTHLVSWGVESLGGRKSYVILCPICEFMFQRKNKRKTIKEWNRMVDNG